MWHQFADSGQALLALAISFYTLYEMTVRQLDRRRQRFALIRALQGELSYFVDLAKALSERSMHAVALIPGKRPEGGYPHPDEEVDSLPESVVPLSMWLASRADALCSYPSALNAEHLGRMLNTRQICALAEFSDLRRRYVEVLRARSIDLKSFPRKRGVLEKFDSAILIELDKLETLLYRFTVLLSVPSVARKPPA